MAVGVTELLQQYTTIKISVTPATILNSILLMSHPADEPHHYTNMKRGDYSLLD
jgi:hypothetical protein